MSTSLDKISNNDTILKNSPLFNLSMASKELFYSNFIYWICSSYPCLFTSVLNSWGIKNDEFQKKWTAYREKNNFDLSVEDQDGNIILIIENKVKSLPYKEQLDKYEEAVKKGNNTKKVLLSLSETFLSKNTFKEKWQIINYKELADAIILNTHFIQDPYDRLLLTDFCIVCQTLHSIQKSWVYNKHISYIDQLVCEPVIEKRLRIHDIRKKILYSHFAIELQQTMNCPIMSNKQILELGEKGKNNNGDTYINWGMTRSTGLIDIKIRINKNLLVGIQIQGGIYKHYIESLDRHDLALISSISSYITKKQFPTNKEAFIVRNIFNSKFLQAGKRTLEGYPLTDKYAEIPNSRKYNKYGNEFIYQYIKIKRETSIDVLKSAIINDYNNIQSIIKNNKAVV